MQTSSNLSGSMHNQPQIIPSLLSCSEDDTEEEEAEEEEEEEEEDYIEEEEDSTIVRPLPGDDDISHNDENATSPRPTAALPTPIPLQRQRQMDRARSMSGSCNISTRSILPLQEIITKNKKLKSDIYTDNTSVRSIMSGGGVEIDDVIKEHFTFSPRWETVDLGTTAGSDDDTAAGNANVVVMDDESTVIQLLPGEGYDVDDDESDIVFADQRMNHSKKNGVVASSSSSSAKRKVATTAAVFVALTVCLGVGYKAGNIMTAKTSSSSSGSSSVAITALTPEDCLAFRKAAMNEEDRGGKQKERRQQQWTGQGTFLRRKLEESYWKRVRYCSNRMNSSRWIS